MSTLAQALHAFQKDAPPIHLDARNPHFGNKYASLGGVVAAIRPELNKHGLVYTQLPTNLDGAPALRTSVMHAESGEEIADVMPLILPKSDPQSYGSALTYARRYALLSILGLVGDEDDDATAATSQVQARQGNGDGGGGTDWSGAGRPADPHGLQASRADAVQPGQIIVPFGKHKGKTVADVPRDYWDWWLAQDGRKNPEILAAVELHLGLEPAVSQVEKDLPF
jgi:uncharacterized protein (DUF3820 family)